MHRALFMLMVAMELLRRTSVEQGHVECLLSAHARVTDGPESVTAYHALSPCTSR